MRAAIGPRWWPRSVRIRSVWSAAGTCGRTSAGRTGAVWDHRHRMPRTTSARDRRGVESSHGHPHRDSRRPRHGRRRRRTPAPRRRRRRRAPRCARRTRRRRDGARRGHPRPRRGARRRPRAALRHLHRVRRARHHVHRPRAPAAAAGEPHPLARRRHRRRGRARGGARAPAAAPADARDRAHRRAPDRRGDLRRDAQRRHHPDRARIRLARLLGRPRAAVARRARRDGRGAGARRPSTGSGTGELVDAADALAAASIAPLELREKEGLALINGTDGMLGMLLLALHDLSVLLDTADVAAAMSIESQLGTDAVFAADLMALRPQVGQAASAANLRAFLADSDIMASHRDPAVCTRVQDAYSLRCSPQVHGAARDTVELRPHDRVPRAVVGRRQPRHHRRRTGGVQRQLPRRAGGVRPRLPRDRRWPTSPRSRSAAPTAPSTPRAATACRRSSRTRSASTRG